MSKPGNNKQRRRQQRKRMQRAAVRVGGGNPYQLVASRGQSLGWYVNGGWDEHGEATVFVLRRAPDGLLVMAAFLIDVWCMGLKDAWGRLDMTTDEWNEMARRMEENGLDLVSIEPEVARRLIAGGIRFARDNGFRLPRRYDRWVAVAGGVGDITSADLRDFGIDGHLRYMGTLTDLKARLIGCSVDAFLTREDVDFVLGDDDFSLLDEETLEMEETIDHTQQQTLAAIRQWCFANGMRPHPRLDDALAVNLEVISQLPDLPDDPAETDFSQVNRNLETLLAMRAPADAGEILDAMRQIQQYMEQFDNSKDMLRAIGSADEKEPRPTNEPA